MRAKKRNLKEWLDIVMECRKSGLSDAAWCEQNDVSVTAFYNAVARLRKHACEIPAPAGKVAVLDLTASKQEVVKIEVTPDMPAGREVSFCDTPQPYLDNSHTIEITTNGMNIKLNSSVSPVLLERILYSLRVSLC